MCLRFVFLLITRVVAWLRLSRREDAQKIAEILILRHQLVVLQRQSAARPKLRGRTGPCSRPCRRDTEGAPSGAAAAGHPGHDPALAPRHHPPPLGHQVHARQDRPATRRNIKALVLRLARENPEWGTAGSRGELAGLGVKVAASTGWEILKTSGVDPPPRWHRGLAVSLRERRGRTALPPRYAATSAGLKCRTPCRKPDARATDSPPAEATVRRTKEVAPVPGSRQAPGRTIRADRACAGREQR